jgi:hypothetical protein
MGQCGYKTHGAWFKEEFENQVRVRADLLRVTTLPLSEDQFPAATSHMNDGKRRYVMLL